MKNFHVNAVGLLLILGLTAFRVATSSDVATRRELTDQQMAMIRGGECTPEELQQMYEYELECVQWLDPFACAYAESYRMACYPNGDDGGGGGDPCIPCPNGGSPEEYGACQQMGGQPMGQPNCTTQTNMTCCQYP